MALQKLKMTASGEKCCPICGRSLKVIEGGAVRIVDGRLDMENVKPKYECMACEVYFREVLDTGYYDEFPMSDHSNDSKDEPKEKLEGVENTPVQLLPEADGKVLCPHCEGVLDYIEGGAVRIVHGKLDMENTKGRYECSSCKLVYRELLNSKYYLPSKMSKCRVRNKKKNKKILPTGELKPLLLKKDANGKCTCPRCGNTMDYVEGEPVKLIDGKPDMENVLDHFHCSYCDSIYRRIVQTDYFQWSEK